MDLKDHHVQNNASYISPSTCALRLPIQMEPESQQRKDKILAFALQLSPSAKQSISLDDHLINDLEYDSVKLIELSVTLEMEFDLPPISEEASANISTVNDIVQLIEMLMSINIK